MPRKFNWIWKQKEQQKFGHLGQKNRWYEKENCERLILSLEKTRR
jgi:hypothetical protein